MANYTIKYGDTLSGIAQRNNTTVNRKDVLTYGKLYLLQDRKW